MRCERDRVACCELEYSIRPFVRGSKRSDSTIKPINHGTKVRIKQTSALSGRPHLMQHARQGDVGVVAGPSKQSPKMAALYVIVRFDICGHDHRMLRDELLEV